MEGARRLPYAYAAWGEGPAVKILVVDDHTLFREGLKFLLRGLDAALEVEEAGTCDQALALAAHGGHELVLLDLRLPGRNGLDALAALREGAPGVPIVVLSGEDDPQVIRAAIEAGAMGFIPKSSTSAVLVQALRLVLANGVYLPAAALESSYDAPPAAAEPPAAEAVLAGITPRQLDVLRFVIQGKTNKMIGRELGISDGTVKQHLSAVLRALDVRNRTEAVYAAAKLGLRLA